MADTNFTMPSSPPQADHPSILVAFFPIPLHLHDQILGAFILDGLYDDVRNSLPALSEETIMKHLKTRTYDATAKRVDEEPDICVICQGEYENDQLIGGLHCRHEYHVECIKKWLQQNNSCPVCKAAAVSECVDKS
ncbi:hypothetical protein AgCh_008505 [Apium graveolens]